jgi:hypothetical protein
MAKFFFSFYLVMNFFNGMFVSIEVIPYFMFFMYWSWMLNVFSAFGLMSSFGEGGSCYGFGFFN